MIKPHKHQQFSRCIAYNHRMFESAQYIDMHCHLDFSSDALALAHFGETAGLAFLSMTVDPHDFPRATQTFFKTAQVKLGAGLHPRWLADGLCGEEETDMLCSLIKDSAIVGEIGLDFSRPYEHARDAQIHSFERICKACAEDGGKLLSIHALRSATCVLDILESYQVYKNCTCIMHWFSGSNKELWRAIDSGCWFSVNERMLATKRGAEYAKLIPAKRLLLETDLPSQPNEPIGPEQLLTSLVSTTEQLSRIRKTSDSDSLREQILANSLQALSL